MKHVGDFFIDRTSRRILSRTNKRLTRGRGVVTKYKQQNKYIYLLCHVNKFISFRTNLIFKKKLCKKNM